MDETADALLQLVESAINGEALVDASDGSDDRLLRILQLIMQRGIEEDCRPRSFTKPMWITNCLKAVECICDKNPLLLNRRVLKEDAVIYKWIISLLIKLLAIDEDIVLREVKATLITLIHLITSKLRLFSYKRDVRSHLLATLELNLSALFKPNGQEKLVGLLSICSNLFSVLTDQELRRKMMIDSSYDQKFEAAARKIDYVLTNMEVSPSLKYKVETIKSHMIISVLNYCISEETVTYPRLRFTLELYRDAIQHPNITAQPLVRTNTALALLKIFRTCLAAGHTTSFTYAFQFDTIKDCVSKVQTDQTLSKTFALINFALDPKDPTRDTKNVHSAFKDKMMEDLRLEVIDLLPHDEESTQLNSLRYKPSLKVTSLHQWIEAVRTAKDALTDSEKYALISSLGDFVCMCEHTYDANEHICLLCDASSISGPPTVAARMDIEKVADVKLAHSLLSKYIIPNSDNVFDIAGLITMHRIYTHFQPPKVTPNSPHFTFVKRALASKNRDVRLLAVRLVPLFVSSRHNVYEGNTNLLIKAISSFDLDLFPHLAESTIMVWGQLAISTEGTGLQTLLIKLLVDFVGSSNTFRSSVAVHELHVIALAKHQTPWQLLSLVLPTLSLTMVQRLSTQPALAQRISDFVGIPIATILSRNEANTVPYLLTYYKEDLIQKIADFGNKSKLQTILDNNPKICASLLLSLPQPTEKKIFGILVNTCPELSKASLADVFSPVFHLVWELLKSYGLEGKSDTLIKNSILFVLRTENSDCSDSELFTTFFQKHTLGIVSRFSDSIRGTRGTRTYDEKLRSFSGLELLVQISSDYGSAIVSALPQIYTCLQHSLGDFPLRESTLRCWRILCQHLEESHLVSLLDQTIATVVQMWGVLDHRCKVEAKKLLAVFFDKSENFRSKHIYTFYSLAELDDLAEMYTKVHNVIQKLDRPGNLLAEITRRCQHDNKFVVQQALIDLSRFLKKYHAEFYSGFLSRPVYIPLVSSLVSALLDILHTFQSQDDVCILCSKCLGQIGALDPTKFEINRSNHQIVLASNFEDKRERIKFLSFCLTNYLVPSFWAAENPTKQVFLAYAMQEFLKYAELDSTKFDINNPNTNSIEYAIWNQFSDVAKSTLTPLASSKYNASISSYVNLSYPIFSVTADHDKWVRSLTLDLLKRSDRPTVKDIFVTCSSLVKEQNLNICYFLMPYAALNLIVSDDSGSDVNNLRLEIMKVLSTDINEVHHLAVQNLKLSYETIFNLLDYFRKWVFARKQLLKKRNVKQQDPGIKKVMMLLDSIPQQLMAERSFQANSYERSALYLEQCHRSTDLKAFGDSFYSTLLNMYANIGDYDALDGVLKKFSTKSLEDRITELEYSENWKMAQDCLEALGEDKSTDYAVPDSETRLLKSLFEHNLYDQTLEKLDSLVVVGSSNLKKEWLNIGLEASVLGGKVAQLGKWISQLDAHQDLADGLNLIYYNMGKALVAFNSDKASVGKSIENAYLTIGASLGLNKATSLKKYRSQLVLLHSLADMDALLSIAESGFESSRKMMDVRSLNAGNDFESNWVLSSVRRAANAAVGGHKNLIDISETWLASSKSARKHNRLDLATSSIMHAIQFKNQNDDLEYAKLLWAQGDRTRALAFIEDIRSNAASGMPLRERSAVQLKYTKWLDYSNNSSSTKIIEEYDAAIKIDPTWEKPYYALGRYYNKLLDLKSKSGVQNVDPKDISGELERRTISYYLKAIQCGTKYLFEALPKVITVWLDFAENAAQMSDFPDSIAQKVLADRKKNLTTILEEIGKASERVPVYYWYTVFSQLLSRLLHPHKLSSQKIISIAQNLVTEYPSHSLWSVLAQYKSTQKERERKGKQILDLFSSSECRDPNNTNSKIYEKSKKLFNQLISVSKKKVPKRGQMSLATDFDFDHSTTPSPLVVPVKTNFNITLPVSVQAIKHHNPFPNSSRVTIHRFENRVDILSSMQQPRHLYLKGTNGLTYGILCKPNDDLRKDAKLMEFTTMIDHLLKKDYESEQRKLHINTYAVIPLNEVYGIIEWVDNSRTMRDIIKNHYSSVNIALDINFIKKILDMDCDVPTKAHHFQTDIMARYPPVMYQWFIENFPDPSSWYDARNNYTRTTAVMSMVGYMLGLGDRHGENLLLNENNGGLLHVDFDCLFEKGLELAVPERVPFRLTRNMVDAFGVTGVEGTFRKSCEVTLSLIRDNETTLMNILESFLHDPILDWSHKRKNRNTPQNALSTIRRKIRGILDKEGLPMSVPGQAEFLIQQATSVENLCQMYIGWMAFW